MSDLSDASDFATKLEEAEREHAIQQHKSRKRFSSLVCLNRRCGEELPPERQEYGYCVECQAEMELRDRIKGYK